MSVQLNHRSSGAATSSGRRRSSPSCSTARHPPGGGPFLVVELDNGVSLDFHDVDEPISPQHYAFLIGEAEFEGVYGRIRERGIEHWADPGRLHAGEVNHHDGGRGVYFADPDDHLLEVITRPYGSGA